MSEENVDLAYRANEAFNRRDLDAWLALTDPGVEFSSRIVQLEGGGSYHGHEGVRRWWDDLFSVFPDFSSEIEDVRDLGDMTMVRVRQHGQGIESDVPTEETQWIVLEWRNKKVIRLRVFLTEREALEAAGLRE